MDFDFSEEEQAVTELAGRIFEAQLTPERRKVGGWFDRDLWKALADAGLLGISLPEAYGGGGQGLMATYLMLEQAGRHAAPVPLLTLLYGALPIAEFGSPEQQASYLPGIAAGTTIVTAALVAPAGSKGVVVAGGRLDGEATCVPAGTIADVFLVAASDGSVHVVERDQVTVTPLTTTTGVEEAHIELSGVAARPLGDATAEWIRLRATVGCCELVAGACKAAVTMTAEYAKTREQFERPIASFQAVSQRIADAFIDAEGVQLTARQAAWRLSEALPATDAVAIAKYWAADAGQRVVHAAQHVHGGTGVDRDYPVHRYFLLAKQMELTLGGSTAQLRRLGADMAAAAR